MKTLEEIYQERMDLYKLNSQEKEVLAKVLSFALDRLDTDELDSLVSIAVKNDVKMDKVFAADIQFKKEALPF